MSYYITPDDYTTAEQNGIKKMTLYQRVYCYAWDKQRAITEPPRAQAGWLKIAESNGISRGAFYERVKRGWSKERAATERRRNVG